MEQTQESHPPKHNETLLLSISTGFSPLTARSAEYTILLSLISHSTVNVNNN